MKRIMASPQIMKHVADLGLIPFDTPAVDDIKAYIKSEQQRWPRRSPTSTRGLPGEGAEPYKSWSRAREEVAKRPLRRGRKWRNFNVSMAAIRE
jgi:hypothetical protein